MKFCAKENFDVQKKRKKNLIRKWKKEEESWKFSREFLWWSWKQEDVCRPVMRKILCILVPLVPKKKKKSSRMRICPGLAVGFEKGFSCECFWSDEGANLLFFFWKMFVRWRHRRFSWALARARPSKENSESVSFENFCGVTTKKKDEIPSQQLPSFMFLSWSWVLWKIFFLNL